jgi:glycosyltransferase involved in cell wall biosynthesis
MLISILVAAYNIECQIEDCLRSCLKQSYKDIEIIVVNDGSTDKTGSIAQKIALEDERIIIINKENAGLVCARKTGVQSAKGSYIFFLDGDDTIPHDAIEALINFSREGDSDIVFGRQRIFSSNEKDMLTRGHDISEMTNIAFLNSVFCTANPNIVGHFFKRDLFRFVKFHEELYKSIGEDLVSIVQLLFHAQKISMTNSITYNYIKREDSITMSQDNIFASGFDAIYITLQYVISFNIQDKVVPCILKPLKTFILGYVASNTSFNKDKVKLNFCIHFMLDQKVYLKNSTSFSERIILFTSSKNLWLARKLFLAGKRILSK